MNVHYSRDDGLKIILSPLQLSAVLHGQSISQSETRQGRLINRVFGTVDMVGGALELVGAAALFLTPEPTMATKVGGAALAANGLDNRSNGAIKLWTGHERSPLTVRAATAAAAGLGAKPAIAGYVGMAMAIAVPLGTAGKVRAARVLAVRGGIIDLAAEEATATWRGGHTIEKHVAKDEAYLRKRLATEPHIIGAGTFRTLADAEKFVSKAMRANATKIKAWASSPSSKPLKFDYNAQQVLGVVIPRTTGLLQKTSKIRIVLQKTTVDQREYFVLTAFPLA